MFDEQRYFSFVSEREVLEDYILSIVPDYLATTDLKDHQKKYIIDNGMVSSITSETVFIEASDGFMDEPPTTLEIPAEYIWSEYFRKFLLKEKIERDNINAEKDKERRFLNKKLLVENERAELNRLIKKYGIPDMEPELEELNEDDVLRDLTL